MRLHCLGGAVSRAPVMGFVICPFLQSPFRCREFITASKAFLTSTTTCCVLRYAKSKYHLPLASNTIHYIFFSIISVPRFLLIFLGLYPAPSRIVQPLFNPQDMQCLTFNDLVHNSIIFLLSRVKLVMVSPGFLHFRQFVSDECNNEVDRTQIRSVMLDFFATGFLLNFSCRIWTSNAGRKRAASPPGLDRCLESDEASNWSI